MKADSFSSSQIPHILCNTSVPYRVNNTPQHLLILNQTSPIYGLLSYFLRIHINVSPPSLPRSSKLSLLYLNCWHPVRSPVHATCPAYSILLDLHTVIKYSKIQSEDKCELDGCVQCHCSCMYVCMIALSILDSVCQGPD